MNSVSPLPAQDDAAYFQVIQPGGGGLGIADLWRYRELLYFLAWRDVKIRYKHTVLGASWAVLQPLSTMLVFTMVFGRLAGLENRVGAVPYPLHALTGLLPWTFFATALAASTASIVANGSLITKVFFPRSIIPLSAMGAPLLDFMIGLLLLGGFIVYYRVPLGAGVAWSALAVVLLGATTTGLGALCGALSVKYRDFKYVIPFLLQIGLFVTPVAYPIHLVPPRWRALAELNPLAGIVETFRAGILGLPVDTSLLLVSAAAAMAVCIAGFGYFRRVERQFADII